ncbi:MAG TPA: hypothetical protein VGF23_22785 [Gaiellaceae bacterium]
MAGDAQPAPTTGEVRRIAAIANPVLRNLEITVCYGRLAAAFAARSGGSGANWCTYATWASRQAGRTIRGEDLLDDVGRLMGEGRWLLHPVRTLWRRLLKRGLLRPETRLGRLIAELHTPFDAVGRASDAVARGNLKVFAEIGLEFARRLEHSEPLERFLEGLRQGEPPDGQQLLRQAFTHYERQCAEPDPRARAQLSVLASLEIGLHEQTRLEEQISEALNAAFATQEELGRRALVAVFPSTGTRRTALQSPAAAIVGAFARALQRASTRLAREVITESFLVLSLPGRVLALGANLADPFPDVLRQPTNAELVALVGRYEPVPPASDDCAAHDWSDLHQRMHYISHLFRAFHLDESLAGPPFTPEQVARIERGVVPEGDL